MEIKFSKRDSDKHVLTCTRKDSTCTWMNLDKFFLRHDLLHYAVEITMEFKSAFYGMIASGVSISDFELPKHKRNIQFSVEALHAEYIVNAIAGKMWQGCIDDFNRQLNDGLRQSKIHGPSLSLTGEQVRSIIACYNELLKQWHRLAEGESFSLQFKE